MPAITWPSASSLLFSLFSIRDVAEFMPAARHAEKADRMKEASSPERYAMAGYARPLGWQDIAAYFQ